MSALLRTESVSKSFGGVVALAGASLDVAEGSVAGLIGPNGSGKTTLFNVITGYERPDAGQVYLAGRAITGARPEVVFSRGVGRTFQLTRIFGDLTVCENMLVTAWRHGGSRNPLARAGAPARRRALELLEFTGLREHADRPARTLSYGQRKLLEFAYTLAASPAIVLLDEPAGGVNPALVNEIAARIRELNAAGVTFLIVEHDMDFVMGLCDRVTVLDHGTVIAAGPPRRVRADPLVLDAYLGPEGDADG